MKNSHLLPLCGLIALTAPRAYASAMLKPTSGVTQALAAKSLSIDSTLRGAFAKTTLTTVYSNPNSEQIEADFLYSAPKGSIVTGFAYWYGQEKVVARVVEKGRATKIYQYITSRMRDPALIEMVGKNSFRARIFPIEANADLKIEIQLAQKLPQTKVGPLWTYPLREETAKGALQDVKIDLHSATHATSNLGTFKNGELEFEKHNFKASADLHAQLQQKPAPIRASLIAGRDGGSDGFFALSLTPNSPVTHPAIKISGVPTYEVLAPGTARAAAGQPYVVVGRYRGSGKAVISLGGQSFEVEFPDTAEKNNLASLLWAADRIESLSEDPKNEKQVMELSKRFGVPSKWTSWLAIPEEERKNFKRQMWASDRADAAKAYAQAMMRSDADAAKAQQVVFDSLTQKLKADGPNYAADEELQPLASYLNDELRSLKKAQIAAKYDGKTSKIQRAQWQLWATNLRKAGADDGGKGVDLPVYVIEDEMRIASRLLMQEIETGRSHSSKARSLKARLKELAGTKTAGDYSWDETTFLDEAAEVRANALAMNIAVNSASSKPDRILERQSRARLKRLGATTDVDTDDMMQQALQTIWSGKINAAATKWAQEINAGRPDSAGARKFAQQVRAMKKRSGLRNIESLDEAWSNFAAQTGRHFAPSIGTEGLAGEAAKRMQVQLAEAARLAGQDKTEFAKQGWLEVANTLYGQVTQEVRAERPNGQKSLQLQAQLKQLEKKTGTSYSNVLHDAWSTVKTETGEAFAREILAKREDTPAGRQIAAKYERAAKEVKDQYDWSVRSAWNKRASEVITQRLNEAVGTGADTSHLEELKTQSDQLAAKAGSTPVQLEQQVGTPLLAKLNEELGNEIVAKREDSAKAIELRAQREKLLETVPELKNQTFYGTNDIDLAWAARAHESAYELLEATKAGDNNKIPVLQNELDVAAKNGSRSSKDVLNWEKGRLDNKQPLVSATDYRLRPGDPLISVLAPANCRQVLAIMPDGTLLPLRYDAMRKAWEARFDVPAGAAQGDYKVQILIVAADGGRKSLTMNFAVDMVAPNGSATLQKTDGKWNLRLETDEQTDRVSAFLPWNERVELRRNVDGIFAAQVSVPQEVNGASQVRFILTDKAHNRTEVMVDMK